MTKREVVLEALAFRPPPYVPWAWDMTKDCQQRLRGYLDVDDLTPFIGSHFLDVGSPQRRFAEVHDRWYRDSYGVVYDTSVDKDIGTPVDWPLKEPRDLDHYQWPDPGNSAWFADIPAQLAAHPDRFSREVLGPNASLQCIRDSGKGGCRRLHRFHRSRVVGRSRFGVSRCQTGKIWLTQIVSIVSTPHAGRLVWASDRPEFEGIRLKTALVATHYKSATCRSVIWKNLHLHLHFKMGLYR